MLDTTGKKLLRLLEPAQPPDVRLAAARVLGELSQRDSEIQQALCNLLDDSDPSVRSEVVSAIGKLRTTVTAYPLAMAATAQQVSDGGHVRGKLVLTVA